MLFELRTYYMLPGKLPDIHKRFADHTLALFEKHKIHVVDFFVDAEGANKIYYVCSFQNRAARDAAFATFRDDPAWHTARDDSEKNGALVERVESVFMTRVPYWPIPS